MGQMARIDARIPLEVKELIDFAASLEGRTRTDFLVLAAAEKARRVIAESHVVRLSLRDQKMLVDTFADGSVRHPDDYLQRLAARYRDTVIVD